jgi:hypothetical protein
MSDFRNGLTRFSVKIFRMERDIFTGSTEVVHESITDGHAVTGAPGQPVGQYGPGYHEGRVGGALKASWTPAFVDRDTWQDTTHLDYALQEEDGISYAHGGVAAEHRSTIGGRHSVKMTRAAWPRIVEYVTAQVRGRNP